MIKKTKSMCTRMIVQFLVFTIIFTQILAWPVGMTAFAADTGASSDESDVLYSRNFDDNSTEGIQQALKTPPDPNSTITATTTAGALTVNMKGKSIFFDDNCPIVSDGIYEAKIKSSVDTGRVAMLVKYSDVNNWLMVGYDLKGSWGWQLPDDQYGFGFNGPQVVANTTYALKVQISGTKLTLWVDGVKVIDTDLGEKMPTAPGKIGFRSWFDPKTVTVDDIKISKLPTEPVEPSNPVTKTNTIESDNMKVTLNEDFPSVVQYEWKNSSPAAILYGQDTAINSVRINEVSYKPEIAFEKTSSTEANYTMSFAEIDVVMKARINVVGNAINFDITDINENGTTLVNSIEIPKHNLISVKSTQAGAALAGARMYTAVEGSGDTFLPLTGTPDVNAAPEGYMYAFINTDELSAGIWTNSVYDSPNGNKTKDDFRVQKQTVEKDGYFQTGLWSGGWTYRASGMTTTEPLPSTKIVITPDANNDAIVDWQDGAIAFRSIMNNPTGSENVPDLVVQRIAMNFASQATNPFLKTLDETKRVYLYTDGLGQNVLLKGYASEGHDSGHPDYGNIGKRQGGEEDINTLINSGKNYNAKFGVHVNATESQPEAKAFGDELLDKGKSGNYLPNWNWIDQAYYINTRNDGASGNRMSRFQELKDKAPGLEFIYVDVWYGDGWGSRKIAREINSLGWRLETEFPYVLEYDSTWNHWAVDKNYGGTDTKGFNSDVVRFIRNHQKDTWIAGHPLLGGAEMADFEGWQGRANIDPTIEMTFDIDVPTKYLQHFTIMKWDTDEQDKGTINLSNNVTVTNNNETTTRIITKDGKEVLNGEKYLLPWDPNTEKKLYHWNKDGGDSTWSLPDSWSSLKTVKLYQLTDQGKVFVKDIAVKDDSVSITANAKTPYVIYKGEAAPQADINWGEGTLVKDPGFNSGALSNWTVTGDGASVVRNTKAQYELNIGASDGTTVSQNIKGLAEGTYSASVNVEVSGKRRATLGVKVSGKAEVENYTDMSFAKNYISSDSKNNTNAQRMRVLFDVPAGSTSADIYLKVEDGSDKVIFDDLRIVKIQRSSNPTKAYFVEDFENIDHGLYPFVKGPTGGVTDPQTHLSELHAPYTQRGWNDKAIDDVINGNWSLKIHNEPVGLVVQTIPQNLRFVPGKNYRVSFKYESEKDGAYSFVLGDGSKIVKNNTIKVATSAAIFVKEFAASQTGESWIGINSVSGADFVLDDLMVEEIDELTPVATEIKPIDLSVVPKAGMTASATSEEPDQTSADMATDGSEGSIWHTKWDGSDALPQSLILNLGGEFEIGRVGVLPRQDGNANGLIRDYELAISTDGITYTTVASGSGTSAWTYPNRNEKIISFAKQKATYVKLTAISGSGNFASVAEMNVYRSPVTIVKGTEPQLKTVVGVQPELPETVKAELSDGSYVELPVAWPAVPKDNYKQAGEFVVEGDINNSGVKVSAKVTVTVKADIRSINTINVTTEAGTAPVLPEKVTVAYSKDTTGSAVVIWDKFSASKYAQKGSFEVEGTVQGTNIKAYAKVTVNEKPVIVPGGSTTPPTTVPALTIVTEVKDLDGTTVVKTTAKQPATVTGNAVIITVTAEDANRLISDATKAIEAAIAKGKKAESIKSMIEIKSTVAAGTAIKKSEISLPKAAVEKIIKIKNIGLKISTQVGEIVFDAKALETIGRKATSDVKFVAEVLTTEKVLGQISADKKEEVKARIADRPVYEFSVSSANGKIADFEGGNAVITIPYTLKDGEKAGNVIVYCVDANGKLQVVNGKYNEATKCVEMKLSHFSTYVVGYNVVAFKDVDSKAWYAKAVAFVSARNIASGVGNGNFAPDMAITRGQFIKMLCDAYGLKSDGIKAENFADAGNKWYTEALLIAKQQGISAGVGNNKFAPEKEITRQEMFTLLYNALKRLGQLPTGSGKNLDQFDDYAEVNSWAVEAMNYFTQNGIATGSDGDINPKTTATRAEMAQLLYNLLK